MPRPCSLVAAQAHILCLKLWQLFCVLLILHYLYQIMVTGTVGLDMKAAFPANGLALTIWPRCPNGRYLSKIGVTPQSYLLLKQLLPGQNLDAYSHLSQGRPGIIDFSWAAF